jgi:glutamate--cysteine ligase
VQAIQAAVERVCADARGVLLIPENHTRNIHYLQNVAREFAALLDIDA